MNTSGTKDLENGFCDHGVATPVSNHRGTVVTIDGHGRNVVLVWLYDHRGGYELLLIDAATGQAEEFPTPFPTGGDCPFAALLSTRNRYYTHFNGHFVEFDPVARAFTFVQSTAPQMAMGMTEDDRGRIWAATYPDSGVVSFDPDSRTLRDYGHVYKQNWRQYQRSVAADDAGWIYFAVGNTSSQIIALDPETGSARPVLEETERGQGTAYVYRDMNGRVYGLPLAGGPEQWLELYRGERKQAGTLNARQPKPCITGSQGLFHRDFPDGTKLKACDLVNGVLSVEDPKTGEVRERPFRYSSEGAHVMGLAAAPDGTVCGGTAFPMRFFSYDPRTDTWVNREAYGQCNTIARQGDRFFVGGYCGGFLLEWDPAAPWVPTTRDDSNSNPLLLTECGETLYRPHHLLAHPDGRTLVLAGTPGYGYTGGGLLFWDRVTRTHVLLKHTDILPEHSTMSLLPLPDGRLLGGTTTSPGTGGEKKASQAELYIMHMETKRLEWHDAVFPGVQDYTDLCSGPNGLVFGIADRRRLFIFDPARRTVLHDEDLQAKFGTIRYQQGPRFLLRSPSGEIFILFSRGMARVHPETFEVTLLAESPVPVAAGGDILGGRIYFASGSHIYSWRLPGASQDRTGNPPT